MNTFNRYLLQFLQLFKLEDKRPRLFTLGEYIHNGKVYDLSAYYIDTDGTLYSNNKDSYETNYGEITITLSDGSSNKQGKTVNTLRDFRGRKVTILRENIAMKRNIGLLSEVK